VSNAVGLHLQVLHIVQQMLQLQQLLSGTKGSNGDQGWWISWR
jgi:hypothetical protein